MIESSNGKKVIIISSRSAMLETSKYLFCKKVQFNDISTV